MPTESMATPTPLEFSAAASAARPVPRDVRYSFKTATMDTTRPAMQGINHHSTVAYCFYSAELTSQRRRKRVQVAALG